MIKIGVAAEQELNILKDKIEGVGSATLLKIFTDRGASILKEKEFPILYSMTNNDLFAMLINNYERVYDYKIGDVVLRKTSNVTRKQGELFEVADVYAEYVVDKNDNNHMFKNIELADRETTARFNKWKDVKKGDILLKNYMPVFFHEMTEEYSTVLYKKEIGGLVYRIDEKDIEVYRNEGAE